MTEGKRLIAVGDLLLDIVITARDRRDGQDAGIYSRPGGSAANVAVWAARAGFPSAWAGTVGGDPLGAMLLTDLKRHGVLPLANIQPNSETGIVVSRIGGGGNRTMHSARGAATLPLTDSQLSALAEAAVIHLTLYSFRNRSGLQQGDEILRSSRRTGIPVSVDLSDRRLIADIDQARLAKMFTTARPTVIFAGRPEAATLTGKKKSAESAVALAQLCDVAIVKQGRYGSTIATAGVVQHMPARPIDALDTTGAGDAFAGTWLARYLTGSDVIEATREATDAAHRAIQQLGARTFAPL